MSNNTPLGEVEETSADLQQVTFDDYLGKTCTLEQCIKRGSPAMKRGTHSIWFGSEDDRMLFNREKVISLIATMQRWVDTGYFRE